MYKLSLFCWCPLLFKRLSVYSNPWSKSVESGVFVFEAGMVRNFSTELEPKLKRRTDESAHFRKITEVEKLWNIIPTKYRAGKREKQTARMKMNLRFYQLESQFRLDVQNNWQKKWINILSKGDT